MVSILEEQLLCTSSSEAIVPPRREQEVPLAEEQQAKAVQGKARLEAMLAVIKNIAAVAAQGWGATEPKAHDANRTATERLSTEEPRGSLR